MAITKILARKGRLDVGIRYVLNGDKTQEQILTAHLNCDPGRELRQMLETKAQYGKEDGVQYYHIIQSFRPGEVSPELALEIARTLVEEHMPGYQAVIGVHVDKEHIHAHIIFNSVNADTGEKYHSSPQSYYRQIRAISDRLCREHGLSVILEGQGARAVSYAEWLRQTRGQPTFRAMLEADLRDAIQDANDLGHFFLLMEHKGWEIKHGNRLGFRLRGQDRFMMPGRKKSLFTEEGIRAAIQGELSAIEQGLRPAIIPRPAYRPFRPPPKYKGFLALYVHYLYLLGKAGQRQYPSRMTPQLRQAAAQAERYAYISQRLQPLIRHWGAGWMSDDDRFNTGKARLTLREDAGRFEIGYPHADGIYGLGLMAAQYDMLSGVEVERYVCGLADYFTARLAQTPWLRLAYDFPAENRCQIVYIKVAAGCPVTDEMLEKAGVFAHFESPDENGERGMRLSFHLYNNTQDIDRFFSVFEAVGR